MDRRLRRAVRVAAERRDGVGARAGGVQRAPGAAAPALVDACATHAGQAVRSRRGRDRRRRRGSVWGMACGRSCTLCGASTSGRLGADGGSALAAISRRQIAVIACSAEAAATLEQPGARWLRAVTQPVTQL
eukprot:351666-Chlamydomonas_euryale.AAC.1